ncbi:uncharacterized protein LOC144884998 isoform X2 [Branchiostoma floridae x Branchiostoma japonicum]
MKTTLALLLVAMVAMKTKCVAGCRTVRISSTDTPSHGSPLTTYTRTNMTSSGRAVYGSDTSDWYLYYTSRDGSTSSGRWVVGNTVGAENGLTVYVRDDHFNADEITGTFFALEHGVWRESPEVKISCTVENVALGKPASQSSTDGSHIAASAVDGEKGTSVSDNQCTLTNPEDDPWWQVDLEEDWPISTVRVLNRGDCCGSLLKNFEIRIKREGQSWESSELCGAPYSETPTNGQSITVDCGRPIIGRYVRVKLPVKSDLLSVCEVEVFPSLGCAPGYIVHGGICYKPFTIPKTRQDALTTCQQEGGTLAMPRHRHTDVFLRKLAAQVDIVSFYWIGLSKQNEDWVWEDGNPLCGFRGWVAGHPTTTNNCSALHFQHADGSWEDRPCETPAKFICQVQPPVDLAAVGYRQYGGAFLRAFPLQKTFEEAVSVCDRFGGGRLAQPTTEDFNDRLKGIVGEESADGRFLFGMKNYEDLYAWLDGTPVSYVNWGPGEPSGTGCVTMTSDGRWQVRDCGGKSFFVCQIGDETFCEMEPPSKVHCGGTPTGTSGQISTPGCGENVNIPDNLDCEWKVTVPSGKVVQLTIHALNLEEDGFLEIFDNCPYGYTNANLTGSNASTTIITTTNIGVLVLHSNGLRSGHGFNISFQAVFPPHLWSMNQQNRGDAVPMKNPKVVIPFLALKEMIDYGQDIVSQVSDIVLNSLNDQEAMQQHQELVNMISQLANDMNDLSAQIIEQGIIAQLHHEMEILAIEYSSSVKVVKHHLDTLNTRLHVTINGTLRPEALAQSWADAVLRDEPGNMNMALNGLCELVMGSTTVFQGKPFMETISALLMRQNLPSSEYRRRLKTVFKYIIYLQVDGYAAWILALKQNGQVDQINEVRRRGHAKLSEQSCLVAPLFYDWPTGTYGLPKTTDGCPFGWDEGHYEFKGDNIFHLQQNPPVHFSESLSNNTLVQGHCMKTTPGDSDYRWPKGSYCILKLGRCPLGFGWGKLGFPGGTKAGVVPDGSSDGATTETEYCCRNDGFASLPIRLPPNPAFYLLRFGGDCQQVEGMDVREEWIEYMGNGYRAGVIPDDSGDDNSQKLYYCLYSVPGSNIPATQIIKDTKPHKAFEINLERIMIGVSTSVALVLLVLLAYLLCKRFGSKEANCLQNMCLCQKSQNSDALPITLDHVEEKFSYDN